jgi:hypothetical protein
MYAQLSGVTCTDRGRRFVAVVVNVEAASTSESWFPIENKKTAQKPKYAASWGALETTPATAQKIGSGRWLPVTSDVGQIP